MKIGIGNDHAAFEMKTQLLSIIRDMGHEVVDYGTHSTDRCDYPIYGKAVAEAVAAGEAEKGIVICTTGIGISIVANKVKGVRCGLCADTLSARMTREHNNANVLAMGAGIVGPNLAISIVDTFLNTEFSVEEKHHRRVSMIE